MDAETAALRYLASSLAPHGCAVGRAAPADLAGSLPFAVLTRCGGATDCVTDSALIEVRVWAADQKECRALAHCLADALAAADEGIERAVGSSVTSLSRDYDTEAGLPMWRVVCTIDYQGEDAR